MYTESDLLTHLSFQLIENLRSDQTCETFLVSQHSGSDLCGGSLQPPPPPMVSSRPRGHMMGSGQGPGVRAQTSIDLGMLAQARSQLQPVWRPQERSNEEVTKEIDKEGEEGEAGDEDVERFIAVPISSTEQYLISSTGQTYLTEKLPSTLSSLPIRHQMSLGLKVVDIFRDFHGTFQQIFKIWTIFRPGKGFLQLGLIAGQPRKCLWMLSMKKLNVERSFRIKFHCNQIIPGC